MLAAVNIAVTAIGTKLILVGHTHKAKLSLLTTSDTAASTLWIPVAEGVVGLSLDLGSIFYHQLVRELVVGTPAHIPLHVLEVSRKVGHVNGGVASAMVGMDKVRGRGCLAVASNGRGGEEALLLRLG